MLHVIATRFNLRVENWKIAKDGEVVLSTEWLDQRFRLFEKYCWPSVLNQRNNAFYWAIFFDTNTPPAYRNRIQTLAEPHDHVMVRFIDGYREFHVALKALIDERMGSAQGKILTTRLDNDDAIHSDFANVVQALATQGDNLVIDVRTGFQLDITRGMYEARKYYAPYNPFISLVESEHSYGTVYSMKHNEFSDFGSVEIYAESPLWAQVIHEKNKANQTIRRLARTNDFRLEDFGIIAEMPRYPAAATVLDNVLRFPKRVGGALQDAALQLRRRV